MKMRMQWLNGRLILNCRMWRHIIVIFCYDFIDLKSQWLYTLHVTSVCSQILPSNFLHCDWPWLHGCMIHTRLSIIIGHWWLCVIVLWLVVKVWSYLDHSLRVVAGWLDKVDTWASSSIGFNQSACAWSDSLLDGVWIGGGASPPTKVLDIDDDSPGSRAVSALDADVVMFIESSHYQVCGGVPGRCVTQTCREWNRHNAWSSLLIIRHSHIFKG